MKYIASNLSEQEVKDSDIRIVLPVRANTGGRRPKCTGPEAVGPSTDGDKLWTCPTVELTNLEKRKIVAKVMQLAVMAMFTTHLYQFAGKVYHQQLGCPIGLRGTGVIARVVLAMTDRRVKAKPT